MEISQSFNNRAKQKSRLKGREVLGDWEVYYWTSCTDVALSISFTSQTIMSTPKMNYRTSQQINIQINKTTQIYFNRILIYSTLTQNDGHTVANMSCNVFGNWVLFITPYSFNNAVVINGLVTTNIQLQLNEAIHGRYVMTLDKPRCVKLVLTFSDSFILVIRNSQWLRPGSFAANLIRKWKSSLHSKKRSHVINYK